jgi:tetratricopeptide (TPR) repeat protein
LLKEIDVLFFQRPISNRLLAAALTLLPAFNASAAPALSPQARTAQPAQELADESAYRQALQALVQNDLIRARAAFDQALIANPKHAPSMLGLAELAFRAKRLDEAMDWTNKAIRAEPSNSDAHATLGRAYALQGKTTLAEKSLRQAVDLDAKHVRARMDLADLLQSRQQIGLATGLYREVVAIDLKHAGAHYALGTMLYRSGDLKAALPPLQKAAELAPENPLPWMVQARVLDQNRDSAGAMAAADKALAIQSNLVEALVFKGDLLVAAGKTDSAIDSFKSAAAAAPQSSQPLVRIGMAEQQRRNGAAAYAAYEKAIAVNPSDTVALNNLAALAVGQKTTDLPQALARANKAVTLQPKVSAYWDTLGSVQQAIGKRADAIASYEKATALDPAEGETLYRLASLQVAAGQTAKAKRNLQAALAGKRSFPSQQAAKELLNTLGVR